MLSFSFLSMLVFIGTKVCAGNMCVLPFTTTDEGASGVIFGMKGGIVKSRRASLMKAATRESWSRW